jgi:hypothetical protein
VVDEQKQPVDSPPPSAGAQPPADPRPGAETTQLPRADDTVAADNTVAAGAPVTPDPEPAKWSARAGVPTRGPRQAAPEEPEWVPDREPSRVWWMPILIGLAGLVLLGLIGLGLWLAMRGGGPTPATSVPPSTAPSSAAPAPTTPAAPSSPVVLLVPVPALANIPVDQATGILTSQGLGTKVVNQVTDKVPPGIVTGTDPVAGTPVPQGTVVTLIVAAAPPSSPSPSPSVGPSGG